MLVKIYGSPTGAGDERRYSPAVCTGTDKRPITGSLDRRDRGRDRPYERPRTQVPAFVANAPRLSTYTGLDEHRPRHPVAGPAPNGLALALAARSLPAKTRYVTPLLTALTQGHWALRQALRQRGRTELACLAALTRLCLETRPIDRSAHYRSTSCPDQSSARRPPAPQLRPSFAGDRVTIIPLLDAARAHVR